MLNAIWLLNPRWSWRSQGYGIAEVEMRLTSSFMEVIVGRCFLSANKKQTTNRQVEPWAREQQERNWNTRTHKVSSLIHRFPPTSEILYLDRAPQGPPYYIAASRPRRPASTTHSPIVFDSSIIVLTFCPTACVSRLVRINDARKSRLRMGCKVESARATRVAGSRAEALGNPVLPRGIFLLRKRIWLDLW